MSQATGSPNSNDPYPQLTKALVDAQRHRKTAAEFMAKAEVSEKMAEYYAQASNVGPKELAEMRAKAGNLAQRFKDARKEAARKAVETRRSRQGHLPLATGTAAPKPAPIPPPTPEQLAAIKLPTQATLLEVPKTPVETGKAEAKKPGQKSAYRAVLQELKEEIVADLSQQLAAAPKRRGRKPKK
jgi:hypothetical protein